MNTNREKSNSGIGLDLLANKDKTKKTNDSFFGNKNINLNDVGNSGLGNLGDGDSLNDNDSYKFRVKDTVGSGGVDNSNVNDLEKLNTYHNTFDEPKKASPLFRVTKSPEPTQETRHYSSNSLENSSSSRRFGQDQDNNSYGGYNKPEMTAYELRRAKREVYENLQKLKDKGIRIPHFTEDSDLDEMNDYYELKSSDLRRRKGVRTMRKVVTTGASLVEFVFGKWNPLNLELEGWSESMNENITDFDDVFEEFAEKYFKDRSKLPVEIRLIGLVLWSALSFHFSNQMAKNMMNNGGKFMGMSMSDMGGMLGMNRAPQGPPNMETPIQETMRRPTGGFGGQSSMNMPRSGGQQMPMREMNGPQGVDDIISELRKDLGENDDDNFSVSSNNDLKNRSKERTL
jgi:hypothetical protein